MASPHQHATTVHPLQRASESNTMNPAKLIPHGATRLAAIATASALALLTASPAHALSCGFTPPRFPIDGTVAAPTNTLLWGYTQSGESVITRLLGPDGEIPLEEREVDIAPLPGLRLPALAPLAELAPATPYTIETTHYNSGSPPADLTEQVTFTTGPGPAGDGATPTLPAVIASEPGTGAGYYGDPTRWVSLEFAPHAGILIGEGRDLESGQRAWWLGSSNTLRIGVTDCSNWPEGAGDRIDGRFGALDGAGNFSGWTEMPVEIPSEAEAIAALRAQRAAAAALSGTADDTPREADCSFAQGASRGAGWASLAFGALAAATLRARRKRRRTAMEA
jgi:hypothetical protein